MAKLAKLMDIIKQQPSYVLATSFSSSIPPFSSSSSVSTASAFEARLLKILSIIDRPCNELQLEFREIVLPCRLSAFPGVSASHSTHRVPS
jgi:hypothetical protein